MKNLKLALCLTVAALMLHSCTKSGKDFDSVFAQFKEFITSFSSGVVSAKSDIQVGLAISKKEWVPGQKLDKEYFSISPSVDGKVVFKEGNIIAFQPDEALDPDTEYRVTLHLSKFIKTPQGLEDFKFRVKTIRQDFMVTVADLQSYSRDLQYLNGVLKTSDNMDIATARKIVTAEQGGKKLPIRFNGVAGNSAAQFSFVIDSIKREVHDTKIKISWNGKPFDIDRQGSEEFTVPGKDNFKVISVEPQPGDNQTLLVNFSDPLRKDQNFAGLVSVENATGLTYATDGNLLKVFFPEPVNGDYLVEVFQGIESTYGYKTKETWTQKIAFEQLKPEARFIKSGTILPASSNLKINFEAVNLAKIDVKVYRIFENNVMQFLQDNPLSGNYSLRKVARPVATKTLELNTDKLVNYGKWNAYAIDLSTIINPEPGAIYRVEMSIKKSYSIYKCGDVKPEDDPETDTDEVEDRQDYEGEYDYDTSEDEYYDYYPYDYDWNERENPCSSSYYYDRKIATNVLASDLGVIAKKGGNDTYFFAVSSITTTKPVAGASIELYTFQRQKIAAGTTSAEGILNLSTDEEAFFAIVKKDKNTTYVKMQDGTAQSVSNYDVDGTQLQKGLKGYVYGERGVWRPGDTLFIGFILNDKAAKLPASHPIKLRLSDPNGKAVFQTVQGYNPKNHYKFIVPTQTSAPTGNWEVRVSVGGAHFYKTAKIETIKPNRLKIKNSFDGKTIYATGKNTGTVEVTWLHGAIAKGLKVEMQAKFSQQGTSFKGYKNYVFDDPAQSFSTEEINIFSGQVNDNGVGQVELNPQLESRAPGMLKAAIITKAYERGGDFSTDVVTATYSPYDVYVGVKAPEGNKYGMLETGKANKFEVATVNEKGSPKAGRVLDIKVYKVQWSWWWDARNGNSSSYSNALANQPFQSMQVTTDSKGKASFTVKTDEDEWGRYLVRVTDVDGGHSAGQTVLIDYPYWSGRAKNNGGEEAAMLVFATDKEKYNVGEKAVVSFPSGEGGRALVSVENGTQVLQTYWVPTQKGETQLTIPVTEKMAPNVYIYITLVQPHATTANDSPIRLYGIVPIEVIDKSTVLEPQIAMPDVLKPETKTTIKVSEKNGKPMTYTIAVVDEGLLDLTRFKTPNAWTAFYAKEALGVRTWDIYDDVIGAYGGKVNQVFSIGGDEDLGGGKAKKANRFKPVVIYLGPYTIGAGQTRTHEITLPQYIGSVRTMVVAANTDLSAYGSAEKATPVRSPLMLLASLPRKATPGEKITLPVTLFAMEDNVKNVTLTVKTNNGFRVVGPSSQAISFTRPDEKIAYFDLEVGDLVGLGKVTVTATSGSTKASYDVELDIINPNPVTTNYKEVLIDAGQSATIDWAAFCVTGTNTARLELSSFPSIDLNRRLDYLIQYPHGCLEQTTSAAFPQVYLADIADIDAARKKKIQKNVTAAIQKLAGFQTSEGGFGYWPGNATPDDWGSTYVGHFFIEAEKKGYALPMNAKRQWISYQQRQARQWRYNAGYRNDIAQAYRLYTLALAGSADLSSMNRLRETSGISNEARLRLAAAYALAGQKNVGQELLAKSTLDDEGYDYHYYYYGSATRNRAMALETLVILGQKDKAWNMAVKIAKDMGGNGWMSTQTTAYSLYAMSKFAAGTASKGVDATYTSKGKSEGIKTAKSFADRVLNVSTNNTVTVKNNKQGTLYVKVIYSGVLPVGQELAEERGLNTGIVFKDRAGNVINVASLAQATEFIAEVTITNQKGEYVENIALTQIIPSGWEIVNTRFTDFGNFAENNVDYTDIRDDRTNFYFPLKAHETKTFRILLNASYPGSYYLPGVQAEAMYDNSYLSRTKGQWVKVVK
ncbi:MAG: MG2 domain-containing protein [Bacteroidota bacterium]